jgi:glycosyltransferase involved in cell wall biosynthesis
MASRASSYKNWSFGIQLAYSMANQYNYPAAWVFCGDGPDLEAFKAEAEASSVAGICHFLGRVGDLPAVLAECDIGFHPSLGEVGYSLAILEFMRSGLPVVVPDRPSVCGATEDGTTGLVYTADDIASAARQMHRLFADPALRLRLGKAAQHDVARRFSLERSLDILRRQVGDYL